MNTVYTMMPLSRSCPLSNPQKEKKKKAKEQNQPSVTKSYPIVSYEHVQCLVWESRVSIRLGHSGGNSKSTGGSG